MTEEQVNHFLTLFIGGKRYLGEKIGEETYYLGVNRNFFTPNDFFHLKEWMEKNEPELWDSYCSLSLFIVSGLVRHDKVASKTIGRILNPSNLFEFLKERREEWGYIDTHVGNMTDGKIMHRNIHPAANYLNTLEAKND